jgi:hypothetical protein
MVLNMPAIKSGYQVSDGAGGWLDINFINDPVVLRKHLIKAMDALEAIDHVNSNLGDAIKNWRDGQ